MACICGWLPRPCHVTPKPKSQLASLVHSKNRPLQSSERRYSAGLSIFSEGKPLAGFVLGLCRGPSIFSRAKDIYILLLLQALHLVVAGLFGRGPGKPPLLWIRCVFITCSELKMAEKGEKGYSQPKGKILKKSVVTKPGNLSKKESSLPDKLNQIEIDSSDSEYEGFVEVRSPSPTKRDDKGFSELKTGKASSAGLDSSGKTAFEKSSDGKGFGAGKDGGKGSLHHRKPPMVSSDKELKLELELPPGAKLVMDCEAAYTLQGILEHLDSLKDQKIKIPESFGNTLQYLKAAVQYTDVKSVRHALESLKELGATDGEICMIANTGPETSEEAYGLIPSLKEKRDRIGGPLDAVLATLLKFKVNEDELPH